MELRCKPVILFDWVSTHFTYPLREMNEIREMNDVGEMVSFISFISRKSYVKRIQARGAYRLQKIPPNRHSLRRTLTIPCVTISKGTRYELSINTK